VEQSVVHAKSFGWWWPDRRIIVIAFPAANFALSKPLQITQLKALKALGYVKME
jgi:hypothetical protein